MSRLPFSSSASLFLGMAIALTACAPAARAEPPIWTIADEDSTIYLYGTIHMLPPDLEWRGPQMEHALAEADELWLETQFPATPEEAQAQMGALLVRYALSSGPTLSSRLTEDERTQLQRAVARSVAPEAMAAGIEQLTPRYAAMQLAMAPMEARGYAAQAGVDAALAEMATAQGAEVRGFETLEQQLQLLAGGSDEDQMAALRAVLSFSDEAFDEEIDQADAAFRAWAEGDSGPLEGVMDDWKTGRSALNSVFAYDDMVTRRNEDWARQIHAMLDGDGVVFIAVGAGHLVGPDSVQAWLAARGIQVQRQ